MSWDEDAARRFVRGPAGDTRVLLRRLSEGLDNYDFKWKSEWYLDFAKGEKQRENDPREKAPRDFRARLFNGHSYGAAVALRAALDAPECVRDVVGVCPCTALDQRNIRYGSLPLMSGPVGGALLRFFALPMIPFGMTLRADAWYPAPAPRGWGASRVFAYIPSQMHTAVRNFSELHADVAWLEGHVSSLRVPLTVVAGAQDLVTPPALHVDWLRRAVPGARIQIVPRVGHWLPRLMPEFVAAAVRGRPSLTPARNPQSEASDSR